MSFVRVLSFCSLFLLYLSSIVCSFFCRDFIVDGLVGGQVSFWFWTGVRFICLFSLWYSSLLAHSYCWIHSDVILHLCIFSFIEKNPPCLSSIDWFIYLFIYSIAHKIQKLLESFLDFPKSCTLRSRMSTRSASLCSKMKNFCSRTILKLNNEQNFAMDFSIEDVIFLICSLGLIDVVLWCDCVLQSQWISKIYKIALEIWIINSIIRFFVWTEYTISVV